MGDFITKTVYRHRRLDNNKVFYIGIGTKKRSYRKDNRNKHWNNIAKKHGYIVEILFTDVELENAKELEMFLIQEYGIENLTNYTYGGDGTNGYRHTEKAKLKLSEIQKGKRKGIKNAFYGKKHTKENIKKISDKQCKKVIDLETGEIYKSAKETSKILGYAQSTLTKYLNGTCNNKTNLRYYE